jgi:hypothetical protein
MSSIDDEKEMDAIRAIIGSFCLLLIIFIIFVCLYKCAICRDENDRQRINVQ